MLVGFLDIWVIFRKSYVSLVTLSHTLVLRYHGVFNHFTVKKKQKQTATHFAKVVFLIKAAFIKTAQLNSAKSNYRLTSENASHFSTSLHNSLLPAKVLIYTNSL